MICLKLQPHILPKLNRYHIMSHSEELLKAVRYCTVVDLTPLLSSLPFAFRVQPIPALVDPLIPTCPWRRTRRRLGVKPSARLSCSWKEPR